MDIAYLLLLAAALAIALVATLALRRQRVVADRQARTLTELDAHLGALAQNLREIEERARQAPARQQAEPPDAAADLAEPLARPAETAAPEEDAAVVAVAEPDELSHSTSEALAGPPPAEPVAAPSRFAATRYYYAPVDDGQDGAFDAAGPQLGSLTALAADGEEPASDDEVESLAAERHAWPRSRPFLGDRAAFHRTLSLLVARALRQGCGLAVCVLDLDDFKLVADRIGPTAGDRVLAEVADMLCETVRPADLVYRIGGDEFAVILPDSGWIDAESLFVRLQATLGNRGTAAVSLSAGIAQIEIDDDGLSLFDRAQQALTRAKAAGKGTAA